MNKHELEQVVSEYITGVIDYHVRYSRPDSAFMRYGVSEYGEVIR